MDTRSTFRVVGLVLVSLSFAACAGGLSPTNAPTAAQTPSPTNAATPAAPPTTLPTPPSAATPTASPLAQGWKPARFVGGEGDMTWTSDCGIVDQDTFLLHGEGVGEVGAGLVGDVALALTNYDAANLRYTGRVVGTVIFPTTATQAGGPQAIDEVAVLSFGGFNGEWLLKGSYLVDVPIEPC